MKYVVLNMFSALAMLAVVIFHSQLVVVGLGLTIVGLTFARPLVNWREVLAMVLMGTSGVLILLDYNWWPIMPGLAGLMLIVATFGQHCNAFQLTKIFVGLSWSYLTIPLFGILSTILMLLMSLVMLSVSLSDHPTKHYYSKQEV